MCINCQGTKTQIEGSFIGGQQLQPGVVADGVKPTIAPTASPNRAGPAPIDFDEVNRRFARVIPNQRQQDDLDILREEVRYTARNFARMLPEGRNKSIAITKLEEALYAASRAVVEG